jgi:hypothetical protein
MVSCLEGLRALMLESEAQPVILWFAPVWNGTQAIECTIWNASACVPHGWAGFVRALNSESSDVALKIWHCHIFKATAHPSLLFVANAEERDGDSVIPTPLFSASDDCTKIELKLEGPSVRLCADLAGEVRDFGIEKESAVAFFEDVAATFESIRATLDVLKLI